MNIIMKTARESVTRYLANRLSVKASQTFLGVLRVSNTRKFQSATDAADVPYSYWLTIRDYQGSIQDRNFGGEKEVCIQFFGGKLYIMNIHIS